MSEWLIAPAGSLPIPPPHSKKSRVPFDTFQTPARQPGCPCWVAAARGLTVQLPVVEPRGSSFSRREASLTHPLECLSYFKVPYNQERVVI
jgi:hypothetical protein